MTKCTSVTIGGLREALAELPANALVEIAMDPELNAGGPIASNEAGAVMIFETCLQKGDQPVIVFWPDFKEAWEDRYVE